MQDHWVALETPRCWRCQIHRISSKEGYIKRSGITHRERCMFQAEKLKEPIHPCPLIPNMEPQDLVFNLLGFDLNLVHYFFTMSPFLLEWCCIFCNILCQKDVLCFFILQKLKIERLSRVSEETLGPENRMWWFD